MDIRQEWERSARRKAYLKIDRERHRLLGLQWQWQVRTTTWEPHCHQKLSIQCKTTIIRMIMSFLIAIIYKTTSVTLIITIITGLRFGAREPKVVTKTNRMWSLAIGLPTLWQIKTQSRWFVMVTTITTTVALLMIRLSLDKTIHKSIKL